MNFKPKKIEMESICGEPDLCQPTSENTVFGVTWVTESDKIEISFRHVLNIVLADRYASQ